MTRLEHLSQVTGEAAAGGRLPIFSGKIRGYSRSLAWVGTARCAVRAAQRRKRRGLADSFRPLGADGDIASESIARRAIRHPSTIISQPSTNSGITLVEMMVTMALLAVIILGLVAMFDQTRKAFTSGLGTVEYQDAGRVALDLIARDLEQMVPGNSNLLYFNPANLAVNYSNLWVTNNNGNPSIPNPLTTALNFYVDVEPAFATWPVPVWQSTTGDLMAPTMDRLLFVTRYNQTWSAVGYKVDPDAIAANGLGTLYQYRASGPSANASAPVDTVLNYFLGQTNSADNVPPGPLNRVIDNVVGFRVRAYDADGVQITTNATTLSLLGHITPAGTNYSSFIYVSTNMDNVSTSDLGSSYVFTSSAIPAYVELEVSVLESRTADRYRSMAGNNALAYLTNHMGQVHIYRQRVSIPGVDRTAYP